MKFYYALLVSSVLLLTITSQAQSAVTVVSNYPTNWSKNVSSATTVGVRYSTTIDKTKLIVDSIKVFGSVSGFHSGTVSLSTDGKMVIFKPTKAFTSGEGVCVRFGGFATTNAGGNAPAFSLKFYIAGSTKTGDSINYHSDDPILEWSLHKKHRTAKGSDASPLYFPQLNVVNLNDPADGNLYVANMQFEATQAGAYRMILDKKGNLLFAQAAGPSFVQDFKPGPHHTYSYFDAATYRIYFMNSSYEVFDSIEAANGYQTDGHELQYTPEGGYIILAINYATVDMREISGGDSAAVVLEDVIQEFDKEKNLIFEWRSLDHFKITDAVGENLVQPVIDFCHANALEFDTDGNILMSSRHMDEITKINRETGAIMWRLGGQNNQFTFINDTVGFSHQHDIRLTAKGTYTLFDNGNLHHASSTYSRAVEYKIDQVNKTVTQVWEFRRQPDVFGSAMGSVQRLANGNTLIGWGACDNVTVTEVNTLDHPVFELIMGDQNYTYRAYKYTKEQIDAGVSQINSAVAASTLSCSSNPVFEQTEITYSLAKQSAAKIILYDQLGNEVLKLFSGNLEAGTYAFPLQSSGLSAGVYYIRAMSDGNAAVTQKIIVMK